MSGDNGALTVMKPESFLALGGAGLEEMQAAIDSVQEQESFGLSDLIRVKTPTGGGTTWEIPDGLGGVEHAKAITGVLCYYQKAGVLWPSFDPAPGALPVLRTYDLVTAEQVGPIPDDMLDVLEKYRVGEKTFDWERLPYNEFGSGKNGKGKRCKEQRLLFMLREQDMFPLVVPVQPGSLSVFVKFFKNLYKTGSPYYGCVIELALKAEKNDAGQPYAQIVPRVVGKLSEETRHVIKERYTDRLAVIGKQVVDAESESESEN